MDAKHTIRIILKLHQLVYDSDNYNNKYGSAELIFCFGLEELVRFPNISVCIWK